MGSPRSAVRFFPVHRTLPKASPVPLTARRRRTGAWCPGRTVTRPHLVAEGGTTTVTPERTFR